MTELAIDGGRPVRTTPVTGWPTFGDDEVAAVDEVLRSGRVNYWTGPHGRAFEGEFAAVVGTRYAVALSNGTMALELALLALEIGPGDEVVVPAATFIGTASAVVRCGARPVIADVDVDSQCLTPETVEAVLTERTRAVVVVHLAGLPAEIEPLLRLTRSRGVRLVEDCAQAHGARYQGRSVGGFGDIAAWSFCQDKILTTAGEGGAVSTSDVALWQRCWELKDHGKNLTAMDPCRQPPGFRWLHDRFGTNARMTEVQAAVGRVQLTKLDSWVRQRQANAGILLDALRGSPGIRVVDPPGHLRHAYYKFYARLRPSELKPSWTRDRVVAAITAEGIPCLHGGCAEIYRERAFAVIENTPTCLPGAAELGRTSLTLPVHPALTDDDVADVVAAVEKVLRVARK
ncbi:MAG TPA: DegT/DnrJ/EryC1/StrS aminotransferase family protein [Pseudonocardiaceae bacterium]|nr:DegT/DnrJ/EryC1/StrS aminotransferase family protein [Pseudonocardiaceae bacterium]